MVILLAVALAAAVDLVVIQMLLVDLVVEETAREVVVLRLLVVLQLLTLVLVVEEDLECGILITMELWVQVVMVVLE